MIYSPKSSLTGIPASVTSLNLQDCTGLTELLIPESINELNLTGCSDLVVFYNGNRNDFLSKLSTDSIPSGVTAICSDDIYSYKFDSLGRVTLEEMFNNIEQGALPIEVDSVSSVVSEDSSSI